MASWVTCNKRDIRANSSLGFQSQFMIILKSMVQLKNLALNRGGGMQKSEFQRKLPTLNKGRGRGEACPSQFH